MGIFSLLFGKPVDKVSSDIRTNSSRVETYMDTFPKDFVYGDFTLSYFYTNSEPIAHGGVYGSVIYMMIDSPVHQFVSTLPVDYPDLQEAIDKHQEKFKNFPSSITKEKTKWLYFNMGKVFRNA